MRLTGRTTAPVFGYAGIPAIDYQNEYLEKFAKCRGHPVICADTLLRDVISAQFGERSVAAGGSVLWQIPDRINNDTILSHLISATNSQDMFDEYDAVGSDMCEFLDECFSI